MATLSSTRVFPRRSSQSGATLVEVLVATLLLAVGLLGVASMQIAGLQNATNANLRTQAAMLAYDIADRMRANQKNATRYQIEFGTGIPGYVRGTSLDITDDDLFDWKTALAANLPQGDGQIRFSGSRYTITIRWAEHVRGFDAAATGVEFKQYAVVGEI